MPLPSHAEIEPTPANTMLRGYSVLLDVIRLERGVYLEEELEPA